MILNEWVKGIIHKWGKVRAASGVFGIFYGEMFLLEVKMTRYCQS
jgi:hypothetical protein